MCFRAGRGATKRCPVFARLEASPAWCGGVAAPHTELRTRHDETRARPCLRTRPSFICRLWPPTREERRLARQQKNCVAAAAAARPSGSFLMTPCSAKNAFFLLAVSFFIVSFSSLAIRSSLSCCLCARVRKERDVCKIVQMRGLLFSRIFWESRSDALCSSRVDVIYLDFI